MKSKITITLVASLFAGIFSASAVASNFKNTDAAIEYRQSAFSLMAHSFGDMGAMLKGKKDYDAKVFAQRAANVAYLSTLPSEGFIAGSDKGDTEALAKVWKQSADFNEQMQNLQLKAKLLADATQGNDKNKIKAAFMDTAKTCKSCHKAYKKD